MNIYEFRIAVPIRLDAIACDSELQEKSQADLLALGQKVMSVCEQAMVGYDEKLLQATTPEG